MKRILWLLLLFGGGLLLAQTPVSTFNIIHAPVSNVSDYVNALNSNPIDKYRHTDQRVIMQFTTGVKAELLSASELQQLGIPVDMRLVKSDLQLLQNQKYSLLPSGRILTFSNQ